MDEILSITEKYDPEYIETALSSLEELNKFAQIFAGDVAEIYDCLARVRNPHRDINGFSLNDAPILGLLVRVAKLLREVARYYGEDNAEIIGILERPLIEAAVMASYLMSQNDEALEDYRKCSYKDRLRLLGDLERGSPFFETKAGKRLLSAIREKMAFEKLTLDDFEAQKKRRWRIQGKSFRDIFAQVMHDDLYPATYGMMSESIHGSWNESMDWGLTRNEDGTFLPYSLYHPADVRFIAPILRFTIEPFRLWLQRIDAYDDGLKGVLDWIEKVNVALFRKFDQHYDGER